MEKEYVIQIAQTIQEQLIGLTPMPVLFVSTAFNCPVNDIP